MTLNFSYDSDNKISIKIKLLIMKSNQHELGARVVAFLYVTFEKENSFTFNRSNFLYSFYFSSNKLHLVFLA